MNQATFKNSDGKTVTVTVGDHVSFKCDIEQSARVTAIKPLGYGRDVELTVEAPADGFSGQYIGRDDFATVYGSDTWGE